jgi:hypothetical protein
MTDQEVFDHVVDHLRRQGRQSMTPDRTGRPICAYRGNDGLKCAVGCLIPDAAYRPDIESWEATSEMVRPILDRLGIDPELARDLQEIHDAALPPQWEGRFLDLAADYGLAYTPPS